MCIEQHTSCTHAHTFIRTHTATGIQVSCQRERTREKNRFLALRDLIDKLEVLIFPLICLLLPALHRAPLIRTMACERTRTGTKGGRLNESRDATRQIAQAEGQTEVHPPFTPVPFTPVPFAGVSLLLSLSPTVPPSLLRSFPRSVALVWVRAT